MHYSTKVYNLSNNSEGPFPQWQGSYAHRPNIYEPLSVTKSQVLKTEIKLEGKKEENPKIDEGANGVMKMINLKNEQDEVRKLYKRHLRIDIKRYLKRIFKKPTHLFPSEGFQSIRFIQEKGKSANEELWKTQVIYLYKPFHVMHSLRAVLNKDPELITKQALPTLFHQLLSLCLKGGGLDNMLMTTSNVYLSDDCQSLHLNYCSFTALSFLCLEKQVELQKHEFYEIFPYIPSWIWKEDFGQKQNLFEKFDKQFKIRAFAINCLALIVGEDIQIGMAIQTKTVKKNYFKKKLEDQKNNFQKLLKQYKKTITKTIKKIQKKKPSYEKLVKDNFFEIILLEERKNLDWKDILSFFVENEAKLSENDANIFKKFHEQLWNAEEQKDFYIQRGISDIKLYIPIKLDADLTDIFKYENWWDVFHNSNVIYIHETLVYQILRIEIRRVEKQIFNNEKQVQSLMRASPLLQIILNLFVKNWQGNQQNFMAYIPDTWKQILGL